MKSLTLLICFILCSLASAQEEKNKTCRILFLERPADAPQTLHLFDGVKSQEVDLPKMNFSKVYEIAPNTTAIALVVRPIEKADDIPAGSPKAILQSGVVDFYLIVAADHSNPNTPFHLRVVDVGNDNLKPGQTLWFNLTNHAIGGELGTEKILIKPGGRIIMNEPATDHQIYPVKIAYSVEGKKEIYPICETRWIHDPRSRSLAFVFAGEGSRTPRVMAFPDSRPDRGEDESSLKQKGANE